MASFVKTQSGKFKAIIRKNGRVLKTKTFTRKTDAKAWASRIEGDRETLAAYGMAGASMLFRDLADEYDAQWAGDSRIRSQLYYLREKLGDSARHIQTVRGCGYRLHLEPSAKA